MSVHFTDPYFLNPPHKITIDLIGLGGTGSQVLSNIARVNHALISLGHPGIHVRAWDNDIVSSANIGRQLFSPADIGNNKSVVLISRVNSFFGIDWEARKTRYNTSSSCSNITISCIDTAAGRIKIGDILLSNSSKGHSTDRGFYWMDLGNLKNTGQVILGTLKSIKQPLSEFTTKDYLPTVIDVFPELSEIKEEQQGPSCSLAEALQKQDLFINSTLAQFGCNLIWKLIREGSLTHHGCYVNMENLIVNPIKV